MVHKKQRQTFLIYVLEMIGGKLLAEKTTERSFMSLSITVTATSPSPLQRPHGAVLWRANKRKVEGNEKPVYQMHIERMSYKFPIYV